MREHVRARGQKTREGTASAVCNRHDRWHRGQLLETMSSFDAEKRPGEKCGLAVWFVEMAVRALCGYADTHWNRNTRTEVQVPWAAARQT